ncbi:hypothetical protein TWF506_002677 [Arthrobotrys conoides]|uniref:Uncharacterized protein n=1 Tax=Arthrobotrys conoides TaxID=74498 RepID=A0AAN8N5E1_9PEZI
MSDAAGSPPGPANVAQSGIPPLDAAADADTGSASPPPAGHARGAIPNAGPSDTPILDSVSSQLRARISLTSRPSKLHGHLGARRKPIAHRTSYSWEVAERSLYHEYVHNLALAGWDNLKRLDDYMENDIQDTNIAVSVIDIKPNHQVERV